jgi:AhpD family alkylhydroperoxidase
LIEGGWMNDKIEEKNLTLREKFTKNRELLNELVMKYAGQNIKRFYNLDNAVFQPGALDKKTKELIGLVASLVLRCEECINYHLNMCKDSNVTDAELEEALAIGLIVGGSITIPDLRRALKYWDEM